MALTRWQRPDVTWTGVDEWDELRQEMNRFLESSFGDLSTGQYFNEWAPGIDLYEDKDSFFIKAEVPGMKKEDIEISLHEGALTISGRRNLDEKHKGKNFRSERFFGEFQRTVTLPRPVEAKEVKASYKDGILTVTLPKAEEAKPKQIAVEVK